MTDDAQSPAVPGKSMDLVIPANPSGQPGYVLLDVKPKLPAGLLGQFKLNPDKIIWRPENGDV